MTAFTYELDHDHPVTPDVEQAIRDAVEPILRSQGLEGVQVIPGLDHDGDPVLYVELKFRLVEPGVDPKVLIQSTPAVRRALWKLGERRFPHLRYDFHDDQRVLGTEDRMTRTRGTRSMKTLDQIRKVLQEHKEELADRFKVGKLGIFGSYARGDHDEQSDLDVIVEFTQPVGFEFIHLADRLEELVGMKVDLLTPDSIKPNRRASILSSVVDVSP